MSNRAPANSARVLLAALTAALVAVGCLDTASKHNDDTQSVAGKGGKGGGAGKSGTGGAAGKAGSGGSKAGAGGEDGGSAGGDPDPISGTGTDCQSYEPAMGDQCGSWYCGVDLETLTMATDPEAKCGGDVDTLCRGLVMAAVGKCARMIKAAMFSASNDELRPLIRDCVYQEPGIEEDKVPADCVDCTIDGAECTAEHCLGPCLAGDSALCDTCRIQNQCDQPVFGCGGVPASI